MYRYEYDSAGKSNIVPYVTGNSASVSADMFALGDDMVSGTELSEYINDSSACPPQAVNKNSAESDNKIEIKLLILLFIVCLYVLFVGLLQIFGQKFFGNVIRNYFSCRSNGNGVAF